MRTLILALTVLLSTSALAQQPKLFKEHEFDAPISLYSESAGYYDCSAEMGSTARCQAQTDFLDHNFEIAFLFSDQRLSSVVLATTLDEKLLYRATGTLSKSFTLILMSGAGEQFDLIEIARETSDVTTLEARTSAFENRMLNSGELSYFFIEQPAAELNKRQNSAAAVNQSPAHTRTAEITLAETEDEPYMSITFSLPKLTQGKIETIMNNAPAEDF
jgi:hypothetical protein